MKKLVSMALACILIVPASALAQQAVKPVPAAAPAAAPMDADSNERVTLATRMIELTPPRQTVDIVIGQIANAAPPEQRASLRQKMTDAFDYKAFQAFVINEMAQTFTVAELKKMIEYHSSPEAASIASKMRGYETRLQPQMTKMIDVALMVARTGGTPDKGAPPAVVPPVTSAPASAPQAPSTAQPAR